MSKIATSENCLAAVYPEIALEWHPVKNGNLTPYHVTAKSGKKVWWMCSGGHEWESLVSNRTKNGSGCPYCQEKKRLWD